MHPDDLLDLVQAEDLHDQLGGWLIYGIFGDVLTVTWEVPDEEPVRGTWKLTRLEES